MQIREIMTDSPATCTTSTSLHEVANMMKQNDCGAIPVRDGGDVVGIVSDRDIVTRVIADGLSITEATARDAMSSPVLTVSADDDVRDAGALMKEKQVRRLVVTDGDGLVGIVAQADLARHGSDPYTGEVVEDISQPTNQSHG